MTRKTFEATIVLEGSACFIPVTFDPKVVFGKVRAPVLVTLNGYTYRSTIASMGGQVCIPLRGSNREAAGLKGGETLQVTLELDAEKRTVDIPPDLDEALTPAARARWDQLSYTHQREQVEAINEAKKPETRARRIEQTVARLDRPSSG
ncbi:YdeI/OmpD-associated family protein [Bradyrhizobium sp. B120]|uniref:YdeI/OmpD-associated family protein n=1 Tax=Bradyrhizobium sp. B120 TaxID=3410088 RepID=UPI003B985A4B